MSLVIYTPSTTYRRVTFEPIPRNSEQELVHLNTAFPKGSYFVLPSHYTEQRFAMLRVRYPFRMELWQTNENVYRMIYANVEAFWLDNGYRWYPSYIIHRISDMTPCIPHNMVDEDYLALMALSKLGDPKSFTHETFIEWVKIK